MAYHITEDGPRVCKAKKVELCPYGAALKDSQYSAHIEDKNEAVKIYEKTMSELYSPTATISGSKIQKPKFLKDRKTKENEQVAELARAIRIVNMQRGKV